MKRKIITTADGSTTIQIEDWDEQYHSIHGAIQEAKHVFLKHGLHYVLEQEIPPKPLSILEIGFGTGLNAYLTLLETTKKSISVNYVGVEAYPISDIEMQALNYATLLTPNEESLFSAMHDLDWNTPQELSNTFTLSKQQKFIQDINEVEKHHLIYFDAFGARVQPELWTETIFNIMFKALKPKGVLVTYSAKGSVRRAMQSVGFEVERLPGPPGKREMLRAAKIR